MNTPTVSSSPTITTPSILDFLTDTVELRGTIFMKPSPDPFTGVESSAKPDEVWENITFRTLRLLLGETTRLHRHTNGVQKIYIQFEGNLKVFWVDHYGVRQETVLFPQSRFDVPSGCWHAVRASNGSPRSITIVVLSEKPDPAAIEWEAATLEELNAKVPKS